MTVHFRPPNLFMVLTPLARPFSTKFNGQWMKVTKWPLCPQTLPLDGALRITNHWNLYLYVTCFCFCVYFLSLVRGRPSY